MNTIETIVAAGLGSATTLVLVTVASFFVERKRKRAIANDKTQRALRRMSLAADRIASKGKQNLHEN